MANPNQIATQTAQERDQFHAFDFAIFATPMPSTAVVDLMKNPAALQEEIGLASDTIDAAAMPDVERTLPDIVEGADQRLTKLVSLFEASRARGYGETDYAGHTVAQTNGGDHSVHIRSDALGRRRLRASR